MYKVFATCLALFAPVTASADCRQALALGLDVSGSVSIKEYQLQTEGLANAQESPEVQEILFLMPNTPISLGIFEWSGEGYQRVVISWKAITSYDTMTGRLRDLERPHAPYTTAIGHAIEFGGSFLNQVPECWTHTLDISGDGKSNEGNPPHTMSTLNHLDHITVNGLVIGIDDYEDEIERVRHLQELKDLRTYFQENVVFGPGSFVQTSLGYLDFERAMQEKLLKELTGVVIGGIAAPIGPKG